jgi:hypothetical protein
MPLAVNSLHGGVRPMKHYSLVIYTSVNSVSKFCRKLVLSNAEIFQDLSVKSYCNLAVGHKIDSYMQLPSLLNGPLFLLWHVKLLLRAPTSHATYHNIMRQ